MSGIERRFVNLKTPIYFRKTAFRPNKAAFCFLQSSTQAKQHQDNFALQGQKRVSKMVIFAVKMVIFLRQMGSKWRKSAQKIALEMLKMNQ
ncbi:MAG: hypothetical protein PUB31_04250 [Bacteroidales bacterium]|nr:hypothetical protein [Bacteroidales bacterium]